jgi:hypothetical protein
VDQVEFVRRAYRDGDRQSGVQIKINGRDLVDLVRAVENPFAYKEGSPSLAGAYAGLPPEAVAPPSLHFLGQPSVRIYLIGSKVQVLGCECGEPGCWPLVCKVETDRTRVRWSSFEQPHRSGKGQQPAWHYDDLGAFEFKRGQYERALAELVARDAGAVG